MATARSRRPADNFINYSKRALALDRVEVPFSIGASCPKLGG